MFEFISNPVAVLLRKQEPRVSGAAFVALGSCLRRSTRRVLSRKVLESSAVAIVAVLVAGLAATAATVSLGVDSSVRPGDDFYGFANNNWLRATRIPEGASSVDSTTMLRELNAGRVRA